MSRAIQLDTLIQEVLRRGNTFIYWRCSRDGNVPLVAARWFPKKEEK